MRNLRGWLVTILFLEAGMFCGALSADDKQRFRMTLPGSQGAVFGDAEQTWTVNLQGPVPDDAILNWEYSANDRTLSRGEIPIERTVDGSRSRISLRTPPVKEGIVFETRLTSTLSQQGTVLVQRTMPVWIFSEDPFFERRQWLKELELKVLDPDNGTVKLLESSRIPFRQISSFDIKELQQGLIIVGEGISLRKHRSLGEHLLWGASEGAKILWIAPRDGFVPFPGELIAHLENMEGLAFHKQEIVTTFDKRLDPNAWAASTQELHRFQVGAGNGRVMLHVAEKNYGWQWVDARFENGGRLILCSFPLITTWNEGPTSRYLFAHILESLTQDPSTSLDGE